jgi:hypothetical protein
MVIIRKMKMTRSLTDVYGVARRLPTRKRWQAADAADGSPLAAYSQFSSSSTEGGYSTPTCSTQAEPVLRSPSWRFAGTTSVNTGCGHSQPHLYCDRDRCSRGDAGKTSCRLRRRMRACGRSTSWKPLTVRQPARTSSTRYAL